MPLLLAILAATICFDAQPGVNWPVWTILAAIFLYRNALRAHPAAARASLVPLVLAGVLASGAAITSDDGLLALILLSVMTLMAVAMRIAGGAPTERVGAGFIAASPLVGALETMRASWGAANGAARSERARESVPVVRGLLIAAPIVVLLWALFAGADPHMDSWGSAIVRAIRELSFVPRVVFGAGIFVLVFGAYAFVRGEPASRSGAPESPRLLSLVATERVIVLTSVTVLLALFLVLQVPYMFGDPAGTAGTGITYAEWAHRGFGELTTACTLVTVLIVLLDANAERGSEEAEKMIRTLALALVVLTALVVVSAFRRVTLYEAFYGYTVARLWAQAFMAGIGLALTLLALEIRGAAVEPRRLARRVGTAATIAFGVLVYWNTDAFIVRRNVSHFAGSPKLDIPYLATHLGDDALPALMAARLDLPAEQQGQLDRCLAWVRDERGTRQAGRWYEANIRRIAAVRVGGTLAALPSATSGDCYHHDDSVGAPGRIPK